MTKFLICIWLAFSLLCLLSGDNWATILGFTTCLVWAAVDGFGSLLPSKEDREELRKRINL